MMEVALLAAIAPFSAGMAVELRLRALTEALEANDDFSRAADDLPQRLRAWLRMPSR
jgi:hypothetical protein